MKPSLAAVALFFFFSANAFSTPFSFAFPSGSESAYRITTFASGLSFPMGMLRRDDGSMVVGVTASSNLGGFRNFYDGSGAIALLNDANQDGVADAPAQIIVPNLPGAVTGLTRAGDYLVAAVTRESFAELVFLRQDGVSYTNAGSIVIPTGGYANIAVNSAPSLSSPGSFDIYFHTASLGDDGTPGPDWSTTGLINSDLARGSIYRLTLDPSGPTPAVSGLTQILSGLRNSAGIRVSSQTGDLFFTDNGFNGSVASSTDELNRLGSSDIGGIVESFGYPGNYTNAIDGSVVGGLGVPALQAFTDQGGLSRRGISDLAFAPASFTAFGAGLFVGFHGSFFNSGTQNQTNPVVFYSFATNSYIDFIPGGQSGLGTIDSLYSTSNSLFLADFSSGVFAGNSGSIYRIDGEVPEPSTALTWIMGLLVIAKSRHRVNLHGAKRR